MLGATGLVHRKESTLVHVPLGIQLPTGRIHLRLAVEGKNTYICYVLAVSKRPWLICFFALEGVKDCIK